MSRDMNKRYKVTLYPLTSIFIGSGAKIETQEYVIKNGYMYKFNISSLYDNLDKEKKEQFLTILKKTNLLEIRTWILNNYKEEYGYIYKVKVENSIEKKYNAKIKGSSNRNENNQLEIEEFISSMNGKYKPGSSLKGAIREAFVFSLLHDYKYETERKLERITRKDIKDFEGKVLSAINSREKFDISKDPFRALKVDDSEIIQSDKFAIEEIKIGNIPSMVELLKGDYDKGIKVIEEDGIKLFVKISDYLLGKTDKGIEYSKDNFTIIDIQDAIDTKFDVVVEYEINKFSDEKKAAGIVKFYRELENIRVNLKQIDKDKYGIIRLGKFTGFNAKSVNILKKNPVKESRVNTDYLKRPLGWAIIKIEEDKV